MTPLAPQAERGAWFPTWLPLLAHLPMVAWFFAGSLFRGRLLFFRDISIYYYPNYVFLHRALEQGVWPLWNPTSDAGAPFLIAYPLDLLLVLLVGAEGALRLGPPLHVLLAMCGASLLARRLGSGPWGMWAAGAFFGASGFVLSSVNLFEMCHAAAWAPWVLAALLGVVEDASPGRIALLGALAALQVSTLGAETVLQTGLAGLCLLPRMPSRRVLWRLLGAGVLALLLAAPTLLGTRALLEGTRRAEGLTPQEAFAWSATPMVLLEAVVPRLFGDVHTFTDRGFWGQPFYSGGFPYMLSLYLSPIVLLLALCAGGPRKRLWLMAALGVLLSLGSHGPLEFLLAPLMAHFRIPVKFFLLPTLALCLLAARGIERPTRAPLACCAGLLLTGALLVVTGLCLRHWPQFVLEGLGTLVPELKGAQAALVARAIWPAAFVVTGALGMGAGLALSGGPRLVPLAGLCACLDLLIANSPLNPTAPPDFYEPSPQLASLLAKADSEGPWRWFSYGVADSPGLRWSPALSRENSDLWLYYAERQSLLPRTHVLHGFEAAFDEELGLFVPQGSALTPWERKPSRYREHHERLRLANVRWVLSFQDLPQDLVELRAQAAIPEILQPLRLYEIRDPLPRAFWVPRAEASEDDGLRDLARPGFGPRSAGPGTVRFERLDPQSVRLDVSSDPGYIVVLEGYHRDWHAESEDGAPIPLERAYGRYWALHTPGGHHVFTVRYVPGWRRPALALALAGGLLCVGLVVGKRPIRSGP